MKVRGLETKREQNQLNEVMNEIIRIVGHHVTAECFGGGSWRVWLRDYHHHPRGRTSDVSGHGDTCLDAALRCLEILKTDKTVREGHCREGCPKYEPCLY